MFSIYTLLFFAKYSYTRCARCFGSFTYLLVVFILAKMSNADENM